MKVDQSDYMTKKIDLSWQRTYLLLHHICSWRAICIKRYMAVGNRIQVDVLHFGTLRLNRRKTGEQSMKKELRKTEAGEKYAKAHVAHYTTKDLREALSLYKAVMAAYPDSVEYQYSRSQIQNIVNSVVPKQELFDAQVELALVHIVKEGPKDAIPVPS